MGPMGRSIRRLRLAVERGQSLVEFALILPIFLTLIIGLMEFSVAFAVQLNVNYASRGAALLAAEAGAGQGADCVILADIDRVISSPSRRQNIQQVRVFWSDAAGAEKGGAANVYARTGSTSCTLVDGTTLTVPYSLIGAAGYPESARCSVVAGCTGGHPTVDLVGVTIAYRHTWITPLPQIVTLPLGGFDITRSNAMRMEPIL